MRPSPALPGEGHWLDRARRLRQALLQSSRRPASMKLTPGAQLQPRQLASSPWTGRRKALPSLSLILRQALLACSLLACWCLSAWPGRMPGRLKLG
jgi:hypothetical protein